MPRLWRDEEEDYYRVDFWELEETRASCRMMYKEVQRLVDLDSPTAMQETIDNCMEMLSLEGEGG